MGHPAIVWFEDFQLTQNAGGTLPDRFQNGHRYTSLVGLATNVGSSVPIGASGSSQPKADLLPATRATGPHMQKGRGAAVSCTCMVVALA